MRAKELKKYKILSAFGNYKQGEFVEFYDAKDDDYVSSLLKSGKIALVQVKSAQADKK